MFKGQQIVKVPNFAYFAIHTKLENDTPGIAIILTTDGRITKITETLAPTPAETHYDVIDTGIQTKVPSNLSFRTQVNTAKGSYLLQIWENNSVVNDVRARPLHLQVYNLDGTGKLMAELVYPNSTFHSQFVLDPTGQKVIYTSDDITTQILHLDRILKENGL